MRTASQLTFNTLETSLKLKFNDSTKIAFDNIDWSLIHSLVSGKYSFQGTEDCSPISLFTVQPLIYVDEVTPDRQLASVSA